MVVGDYHRRVAYHGNPRETTEASSRAQILAPDLESSPLTSPPGPPTLRLFRKQTFGITTQKHSCVQIELVWRLRQNQQPFL